MVIPALGIEACEGSVRPDGVHEAGTIGVAAIFWVKRAKARLRDA